MKGQLASAEKLSEMIINHEVIMRKCSENRHQLRPQAEAGATVREFSSESWLAAAKRER